MQVRYQAFRRTREIWSPLPLTNNLRFWLAVLSFSTAIFALVDARWKLMESMSPSSAPLAGYILGYAALLGIVVAIISLLILIVRSVFGTKVDVDLSNVPPYLEAGLSKRDREKIKKQASLPDKFVSLEQLTESQIEGLRRTRAMLNNLFTESAKEDNQNDDLKERLSDEPK
jgi:hypothetical protein